MARVPKAAGDTVVPWHMLCHDHETKRSHSFCEIAEISNYTQPYVEESLFDSTYQ